MDVDSGGVESSEVDVAGVPHLKSPMCDVMTFHSQTLNFRVVCRTNLCIQ